MTATFGIVYALFMVLEPPHLVRAADATLELQLDGAFMDEPSFQRMVRNGLTTTLELTVTVQDGNQRTARAGALVEIRYELWDELFLVAIIDGRGDPQPAEKPSPDAIRQWFQTQPIFFGGLDSLDPQSVWNVELTLRVIPFSEKEHLQTVQWVNQSIRSPGGQGNRAGNKVLAMIVGTSIKRSSLLEYGWTYRLQPKE